MWLLVSLLALLAIVAISVAGFAWVGRSVRDVDDEAWK